MNSFSVSFPPEQAKAFLALRLTKPPRTFLVTGVVLVSLAFLMLAALTLVPWRQTVIAQGEVSVFDPLQRPQAVESQIKGRLVELLVKEGDTVQSGQVMARLEDLDSKFLDPAQVQRLAAQIEALEGKRRAAFQRMSALQSQIQAVEAGRVAKLSAAQAKVSQARQKLEVNRQLLALGQQNVETARLQKERVAKLEEAGLKSRRDLELSVRSLVEAEAKLNKMQAELLLNEQEIQLTRVSMQLIPAEAAEKTTKIEESLAKVLEGIAETEEKLEKLNNESGALQVRRSLQTIVAPRAGRVVNLKKLGQGQLLKEGETVARIVPENPSLGVELYLSGVDAPLVEVGVPVRLMFEGFPAVPFAGWDWASVGTFGGRVVSVDPVNTDDKGKKGFRVWVMPDETQERWPGDDRLRIGSKARGWLQLNEVPLYYEFWRQLNAFPAKPVTGGEKGKPKQKAVIRR